MKNVQFEEEHTYRNLTALRKKKSHSLIRRILRSLGLEKIEQIINIFLFLIGLVILLISLYIWFDIFLTI